MNMELYTEKLIELISARLHCRDTDARRLETELRALVRENRQKGGDATMFPKQPNPNMTTPPNVQSEGRGELLYSGHPVCKHCGKSHWMYAECPSETETKPKPHNPAGLESPGEGYRFLDEDEIKDGPFLVEIELWIKDNGWDNTAYGNQSTVTYRTRLSRAELAALREANGDQAKALEILRNKYHQANADECDRPKDEVAKLTAKLDSALVLEAVRKLSLATETDAEDIIDSLTGIAWDEEDAGEIKRELEKE